MNRDNSRWLSDLSGVGEKREVAVADLREVLLRNLYKTLVGRSVDSSFAEDAAQDSLLRILDRLEQFEGRSQFLTWATAIAIRVALGELRRRRWTDVSLDELVSDANFSLQIAVGVDSTPDLQIGRNAMIETMRVIIEEQLTAKQRTALLAELKGMPQDEIARQLGSNRNAVYKLTHDARKRLKRGLEAAGYTAEDVIAPFAS